MDSETRETLNSIGRTLESHNEAFREAAATAAALREIVRLLGARVRALERRSEAQAVPPFTRGELAMYAAAGTDAARRQPVGGPRRHFRWRVVGEWVEAVLIEICRHPYAAIAVALLIGLAFAALEAELSQ